MCPDGGFLHTDTFQPNSGLHLAWYNPFPQPSQIGAPWNSEALAHHGIHYKNTPVAWGTDPSRGHGGPVSGDENGL